VGDGKNEPRQMLWLIFCDARNGSSPHLVDFCLLPVDFPSLSFPVVSPLLRIIYPHLLAIVVSSPRRRRVALHRHYFGALFHPGGEAKLPTSLWKGEGRVGSVLAG